MSNRDRARGERIILETCREGLALRLATARKRFPMGPTTRKLEEELRNLDARLELLELLTERAS